MEDNGMTKLKERVERDLGIKVHPNMTTKEAGMIGGHMVQELIREAEKNRGMEGEEEQ
jgi:hypothetical protein